MEKHIFAQLNTKSQVQLYKAHEDWYSYYKKPDRHRKEPCKFCNALYSHNHMSTHIKKCKKAPGFVGKKNEAILRDQPMADKCDEEML